jgi:hypothetical protein
MEFLVHDRRLYMDSATSQYSGAEEWSRPRMGRRSQMETEKVPHECEVDANHDDRA